MHLTYKGHSTESLLIFPPELRKCVYEFHSRLGSETQMAAFAFFKYFEQRRVQADSLFKLSETAFEVVNEASELAWVKIITIILKALMKLVRFQ